MLLMSPSGGKSLAFRRRLFYIKESIRLLGEARGLIKEPIAPLAETFPTRSGSFPHFGKPSRRSQETFPTLGNLLDAIGTFPSLIGTFRFQTAISALSERDVEVADRNIAVDNRNFAPDEEKVTLSGNPACIPR
ncbi:MAG: hypothetical protein LBK96_06530, partial [Prevotellaceae bacterium]|nr:hypothetical protein [Prevotellaceae bacterium]